MRFTQMLFSERLDSLDDHTRDMSEHDTQDLDTANRFLDHAAYLDRLRDLIDNLVEVKS